MTGRLSRAEIDAALRSGPVVTPSNTSPWHGAPVSGSRWSAPQLTTLRREFEKARASREPWAGAVVARLKDPERVETVTIALEVGHRSAEGAMPEIKLIECPLLAWRKDRTRALIVAPGGDKLWMKPH